MERRQALEPRRRTGADGKANHAPLLGVVLRTVQPVEGKMQDDTNQKGGRRREAVGGSFVIYSERTVEVSIRQAFLTHMDEQQRQYAGEKTVASARRPPRSEDAKLVERVRQQQDTGNHDKPGEEARGSDKRGGTRAGAENVEPRKR